MHAPRLNDEPTTIPLSVFGADVIPFSTPGPASAVRTIGDQECVFRVWTHAQWAVTPEAARPAMAQPIEPLGWIDISTA